MAEKTTTTREEKDSAGNKSREETQTERDSGSARRPANPAQPGTDSHKSGPGSDTNPTGIGGNEESVSG